MSLSAASPDVIDIIATYLIERSSCSLVACASCCQALRASMASYRHQVKSLHLATAALCAKVDRRLFESKFGEKRRPLGVARATDFLVPSDPQDASRRLEWIAGSLYLPWGAEGRADGLRWREAGLEAADARVASVAIGASPHLLLHCEVFDWSANPIGDEGALVLAPLLLRRAPRLSTLELASCNLTDSAAVALAEAAAAFAPQLRRLVLSSNPIGDAGCGALAAALASLPQLAVLQLGDTEVGDAGAAALAAALDSDHAPALMQLWLACTLITPTGRLTLGMAEVRHQARALALTGQPRPPAVSLRICW